MSRSVTSTVKDLRAGLTSLSGAWAAWRDAACNAQLAAVMGPILSRHLRFNDEYSAVDSIESDFRLRREIDKASEVAPGLLAAVENHIQWVVDESRRSVEADLTLNDPQFTLNTSEIDERVAACEREHSKIMELIANKLNDVEAEAEALISTRGVTGVSSMRRKVIDDHQAQMKVITEKAKDLRFCDKAREEITEQIRELKQNHSGEARAFYHGSEFQDLQADIKRTNSDRVSIEVELRQFFDHHSQGASESESVKVERTALRLPPKLEEGKQGYKLITAMEDYLVGRGNECWAIIPDLRRMAHDIDPIEHMHWMPPVVESDIPEALREHRRDQNRALAEKLLSLCSQMGLRSLVLATGTYGAKKVSFRANPNDGCAIFWVLLQKYHPVDLKQRVEIERDLNLIHTKFVSGDPKVTLKTLREKIRQAMDISCRIKWHTAGVPLIETLSTRNPQFTMSLDKYRDMPDDPEDSVVELDLLAGEIEEVIKVLDNANTDWNSKRAYAVAEVNDEFKSKVERELKAMKSMIANAQNRNDRSNPNSNNSNSPNLCQKVNCSRKIEGWKQGCNWKLCSTCLLDCVKERKDAKLKDGSVWKYRPAHQAKRSLENEGLKVPKALKAMAAQEAKEQSRAAKRERESSKNERDNDDDDAPSKSKKSKASGYAKRLQAIREGEVLPNGQNDDDESDDHSDDGVGSARVARGGSELQQDAREIIEKLRAGGKAKRGGMTFR